MSTSPLIVPLHLSGNTSEEQNLQLRKRLGEAVEAACKTAILQLDLQSAQNVLENRKLQSEVAKTIVEIIQRHTVSDQFKNEEARSNRAYPTNYRVRPIEAQVTELRKLFPALGNCQEKLARRPLPEGAEAWFAIPRWRALASTYNRAVELLLEAVANRRKFANRVVGRLDDTFLRQSERSILAEEILADQQQGSDILVIAAQAGTLHRGSSARRTRVAMAGNEFGLGTFAVAAILLTHPERLSSTETLMIDCCGDQYSLHSDRIFDRVPLFDYDITGVELSAFYEDRARDLWGSPTGFLYKLI
jgi:hypothetical protein